ELACALGCSDEKHPRPLMESRRLRFCGRAIIQNVVSVKQPRPRSRYLLDIEGSAIPHARHVARNERASGLQLIVGDHPTARLPDYELTALECTRFSLRGCPPAAGAIGSAVVNRYGDGLVAAIGVVAFYLVLALAFRNAVSGHSGEQDITHGRGSSQ